MPDYPLGHSLSYVDVGDWSEDDYRVTAVLVEILDTEYGRVRTWLTTERVPVSSSGTPSAGTQPTGDI